MVFAKLAAMIGALGCAAAGVALVASGMKVAALVIVAAAIVAATTSEGRETTTT